MAPQPPVKRATWADQASGFELPSRQHTAGVQERGNAAPAGPFPRGMEEGMEIIDTRCGLMSTTLGLHNPQHLRPSNIKAGATVMAGQITHQVVNAR